MANQSLCARCQSVLATTCGNVAVPEHHPDGNSFREALRIGCRFCLQIWAQLERPTHLRNTRYHIRRYERDLTPYDILVFHNDRLVRFTLEAPDMIPMIWLENNTGSDQSFQFIISKYSECMERHQNCTKSPSEPYLPQRLIHVGERGQQVTLVDREDISPDSCYVTLSHCWGQNQPLKLTAGTSSRLKSGVELRELPKTFQDAIQATRRLGFKWIWIDSLCIFQDSIDDWSVQASAMEDIYEYAVLNIAATAASDGSSGLFNERDSDELAPFIIETDWRENKESPESPRSYTCFREMSLLDAIDKAPLNKRGWVMQERLLSRRIVHFGREIVYWECHERFASEIYPNGFLPASKHEGELHTKNFKELLGTYRPREEPDEPRQALYECWRFFVHRYTSCQLTYPRDRMVAVAGVARRVETVLKDELIAGLWRSRFVEQLCWETIHYTGRGRPNGSAKPWIAPSWSWASCEYISDEGVSAADQVSRHLAQLTDVDIHAEHSGALIRGSATLLCNLVPAKLCFRGEGVADVKNWMSLSSECDIGNDPQIPRSLVHLDGPCFTAVTSFSEDVFLLPLVEFEWKDSLEMVGIVVIPSETEDGAYRRIGRFDGEYPKSRSSTEVLAQHDGPGSVVEMFYTEVSKYHKEGKDQTIKIV